MTREDAEEFTQSLGQIVGGSWRLIAHAHKQRIPQLLDMTTEQWVRERLGGYMRMPVAERREAVLELTNEGMSNVAIGQVLGVDETTARRDRASAFAEPGEENDSENNECNEGASANAESAVPPRLACEADPRIDRRSYVLNVLCEAERLAEELPEKFDDIFDFAPLADMARAAATKWSEIAIQLQRRADDETQKSRHETVPQKSTAQHRAEKIAGSVRRSANR